MLLWFCGFPNDDSGYEKFIQYWVAEIDNYFSFGRPAFGYESKRAYIGEIHVHLDKFDVVVVVTRCFNQVTAIKPGLFSIRKFVNKINLGSKFGCGCRYFIWKNWGLLRKTTGPSRSQMARLSAEMDWGDMFNAGNILESFGGAGRGVADLTRVAKGLIIYLIHLDLKKRKLASRINAINGQRQATREIEKSDCTSEVALDSRLLYGNYKTVYGNTFSCVWKGWILRKGVLFQAIILNRWIFSIEHIRSIQHPLVIMWVPWLWLLGNIVIYVFGIYTRRS